MYHRDQGPVGRAELAPIGPDRGCEITRPETTSQLENGVVDRDRPQTDVRAAQRRHALPGERRHRPEHHEQDNRSRPDHRELCPPAIRHTHPAHPRATTDAQSPWQRMVTSIAVVYGRSDARELLRCDSQGSLPRTADIGSVPIGPLSAEHGPGASVITTDAERPAAAVAAHGREHRHQRDGSGARPSTVATPASCVSHRERSRAADERHRCSSAARSSGLASLNLGCLYVRSCGTRTARAPSSGVPMKLWPFRRPRDLLYRRHVGLRRAAGVPGWLAATASRAGGR
jgi:hypothetical protein